MRTYGNSIMVQRGESFTIDKLIKVANGDPYIVSSELKNPYLVLTVSSSEHTQSNRYLHNYWLKGFKTFLLTVPVNLKSILTSPNGESRYPNGFDDITELSVTEDGLTYIATGYYNGKDTLFEPGDAVFYVEDLTGNKTYKYWDTESNSWEEYRFRLTKTFLSSDTRQWVPQNYVWSIQLVSGIDMMTYLTGLCDYHFIAYEPYKCTTDKERDDYCQLLYDILVGNKVSLPTDFNPKLPLGSLDTSITILPPSKLSVLPTSRGVLI